MAKILNLDSLAPNETRELRIAGVSYPVKEMDVETFIESSKLAESMTGEQTFSKQMEVSVRLIKMAIPTIDDAVLGRLTMEQMAAVSKFVRGEDLTEASSEGEAGKA